MEAGLFNLEGRDPRVTWERVHVENAPCATLVRTKTGHQRHVPIPQSIVRTLEALRSHGTGEDLFPFAADRSMP
jgi:hypothetical protein